MAHGGVMGEAVKELSWISLKSIVWPKILYQDVQDSLGSSLPAE